MPAPVKTAWCARSRPAWRWRSSWKLPPEQVLPFSTGVIMESLPNDRIEAGLPAALADLQAAHWAEAAEAIMTTDTVPKAASRQLVIGGKTVTVTGISKGAGMIRPNMATMLGFIATDAAIAPPLMQELVREAADRSFNRITIDGDTSTNDSFVLIATHQAGHAPITQLESADGALLREAVIAVAQQLAQAIVRDGEGATKFITVRVDGGKTKDECRQVAYAIAHSPLVKTAFFASDPNLGRILAAVGYAGIADLDQTKIDLFLDDVLVAKNGGRHPAYREEDGAACDEAERDHRAGRSAPRPGPRHCVDLRSELRLREDQRRLPQLIGR